jgi:hypothetical protein
MKIKVVRKTLGYTILAVFAPFFVLEVTYRELSRAYRTLLIFRTIKREFGPMLQAIKDIK